MVAYFGIDINAILRALTYFAGFADLKGGNPSGSAGGQCGAEIGSGTLPTGRVSAF